MLIEIVRDLQLAAKKISLSAPVTHYIIEAQSNVDDAGVGKARFQVYIFYKITTLKFGILRNIIRLAA